MKITIKEIDAATGEERIFERDETKEEQTSRLANAAAFATAQAEAEAKATEKAALLAKLGITESEAALLLS